ncbi:1-acyl-sn-glycerol-3-phosphate acyltransferase [Friedmanniella endophytica]|uniref:1-acyl-sn-glycerol-3-phosphate acyltransferase n=1 Tax=Microlunatus kandeliicorticis TaxID=1759536 RepID=A0A7W3P5V4_9ACTN|nr:lysophospholipid acyltransferase family protein [Microlunatus kandeliicorticis]MBA8794339.1 1-acyl-sn-glycerol-3-phosphate acyltransferase [Microlunatus kandeliicorticis]
MLYWFLKLFLVEPFIKLAYRPWVEGGENVPDDGPAILVSNHLSAGDTVLIPALLKRRFTFAAKQELFQGRGPRGRLLGWFLRAIKIHPIDRSGGRASATGMADVSAALADGGLLCIFPEGTRSPDGRLYKGKTGAARLVLAAGVPVLPVAVAHTEFVRNRFGVPTLRRPGIVVGKPMDFTEFATAGNNRDALRWVTDEMMNAIMELSGQVYVDVYGSVAKADLAAGRVVDYPTPPRPGWGRPRPVLPAAPTEAVPAAPQVTA